MSVNILGGRAKGHALFVPHSSITRPTSVMLRRRFFDAHQDMTDIIFIDLCAGSGAMGIEALSRGAEKVYLNEQNPKVLSVLKKNKSSLKKFDIEKEVTITKSSCVDFLKNHRELDGEDTFIFFDPPYEDHALYKEVLKELKSYSNSKCIIETDRQKGIKKEVIESYDFHIRKEYKQGTSYIYILE